MNSKGSVNDEFCSCVFGVPASRDPRCDAESQQPTQKLIIMPCTHDHIITFRSRVDLSLAQQCMHQKTTRIRRQQATTGIRLAANHRHRYYITIIYLCCQPSPKVRRLRCRSFAQLENYNLCEQALESQEESIDWCSTINRIHKSTSSRLMSAYCTVTGNVDSRTSGHK